MTKTIYTIVPLRVGEAEVGKVLDVFWSLTKSSGTVTVPLFVFLVLGGPHPILIDTGMRSAERAMAVHRLGPHRIPAGQSLPEALALHGLKPEDIGTCILTHLHYDHAGGCELLPNARFIVQRSELAAAAAPIGPKTLELGSKELFYDRLDVAALVDTVWDRVDLIEGDQELFDGIECVLYANTHTPGSQSVYVRTAQGIVAIVGDIVRKVDANLDTEIPAGLFYDLEAMMRAIKDIKKRADIVWPSHDPVVLQPITEDEFPSLRSVKT